MDKITQKIRIKYSWLTQEESTELVENALGWFYAIRYPCEPTADESTRPIDTFMDRWAVERICDEIAQRNGFNTALGYRENGIQFTFDSAWISESLKKAIVPMIGVV
jgi:hypothetical protein